MVAEAVTVAGRDAVATAHAALIELVAEAVTVAGRDAVAATHAALIELQARTVILRRRGVVVTGGLIIATVDFVLVANAVSVGVIDAPAFAIFSFCRVLASGVGVIARAISTDGQIEGQEIHIVTSGEHLNVQVSGELTIGGELPQQHGAVRFRQTIDVSVEDVPHATHFIVNDDVSAGQSTARFEGQSPILIGRIHGRNRSFAICSRCWPFQSYGHPAVKGQFRETWQQQWVDILRGQTAQDMLEERRGRGDLQGFVDVAVNRSHKVRGVLGMEVDPVRGHSGEVARGVVCNRAQLHTVSAIRRWWCVGQ